MNLRLDNPQRSAEFARSCNRFLRRRGDDASLRSVEAAAILFTVLLVFLEIRHAINGGDVYRSSAGLTETALQVCAALAMAFLYPRPISRPVNPWGLWKRRPERRMEKVKR